MPFKYKIFFSILIFSNFLCAIDVKEHATDQGRLLSIITGKVMAFTRPESPRDLIKVINIKTFSDWEFPADTHREVSRDSTRFLYEVMDKKQSNKRLILYSNAPGRAVILGIPQEKGSTTLDLSQVKWRANSAFDTVYYVCKDRENNNGFLAKINLRVPTPQDMRAEFGPNIMSDLFSNPAAPDALLEVCEEPAFWRAVSSGGEVNVIINGGTANNDVIDDEGLSID